MQKDSDIMGKKLIKNGSMFILYFIYEIIPLLILKIFKVNTSDWNNVIKNIYLISTSLIYLIFVIIVYKNELKKDLSDFKKNGLNLFIKYLPIYIVGILAMGISNSLLYNITDMQISNNEQSVREYIKLFPIYMSFSTVIYAPIVEEITFRKTFRNIINNKYIFIIISGIIFGLIHITGDSNNINDFLMSIPYMIMGFDLAYIYYKSNNIFTTISIHSFHNFALLLIQFIGG